MAVTPSVRVNVSGARGASNYQLWLGAGHTGTVADYLAWAASLAAGSTIYGSTAAGLAATANGDYFLVVGSGETWATLYQDVSGSAVEIAQLPSATFLQSGTGAVARTAQSKLRESVSPQDFGAAGDGIAAATEHAGIESALDALRNTDDAFFSRALSLPSAVYYLTAPVDLLQSFTRIYGAPNALIRGAAGQHVLRADGASLVASNFSRLSLYGGVDSVHAGTAGEIAQLFFDEVYAAAYTGSAFYFSAGLTSSRLTRLTVNGIFSTSGHAIHCDGGLNNNNMLGDSDFFNVSGDVVRVENQANGWQIRNLHLEGEGKVAAAQYHLEAPIACHILGGWSEASHEYLVRTTAQADPLAAGVMIDGLVSIGSAYGGGGFVGSKFDTGTNRIIFGSNHWAEVTTAPTNCFIYGVNRKLRTNDSTVWTRDAGASFQLTTPAKRAVGTTRSLVLTFNRPNDSAGSTNQQVITARVRANFGVLNGSGTAAHGAIEWHVTVRGAGAVIAAPLITKVTENDGYSAASVTATCTAGSPGATEVLVTVEIGSVHATEPGFLQAEIEGLSSSYTEADRFALSVA